MAREWHRGRRPYERLAIAGIAEVCAIAIVFLSGPVMPRMVSAEDKIDGWHGWAPPRVGTDADRYFVRRDGIGTEIEGRNTLYHLEFGVSNDWVGMPLPNAHSHGYGIRYPFLHQGDLIPLAGYLYEVGAVVIPTRGIPQPYGVNRLPSVKYPTGIGLRLDTYVFPLSDQTDDGLCISGRLHKHFIYVWQIAENDDAKPGLKAKVGTLGKDDQWPRFRVKDIVWHWYREGDWVEIGEYRHKLLKIVPPIEADKLNRGGARMVGWIELDRHAEPLPAGKPNEKE